MVKKFVNGGPVEMVLVQALENKVFCIIGNVSPAFVGEGHLLLADILVNLFDVFAVKGCFSTEKLVSDATHAPHVNFFRILLVHHQLRRHV